MKERTHKEFAQMFSTDELRQQAQDEQSMLDYIDANPGESNPELRAFSVERSKAIIEVLVERSGTQSGQ